MASEIQVKDTVCALCYPAHIATIIINSTRATPEDYSLLMLLYSLIQLLLAGVPGQSGPALATHAAVGRGSD